jgi:glycosyltransferase involved in cell wall biosynthesis
VTVVGTESRPPLEGVKQTLTVVIPTKNEAHLLAGALESVSFADEIIVVDMHSRDETPQVCSRFPQCRLVQRDGYIHASYNYGFDLAASDWVMRLDSDERITPELAREIDEILTSPPPGVTGFEFWERIFILGRELRHGFGRKHFRHMMFRRGAGRYPLKHQHEALEAGGTWLRATHGYVHYNYKTVGEYLRKIDYYTDRDQEQRDTPATAPRFRDGMVEPARAFYLYYLKYRGYRDGWIGLLDASMRALYQLVAWAKTRERWEREHGLLE